MHYRQLHLIDLRGVGLLDFDSGVYGVKWLDADLVFVLEDERRYSSVHQEVDVERALIDLVEVESFLEDWESPFVLGVERVDYVKQKLWLAFKLTKE